jgi:hypothetical protein
MLVRMKFKFPFQIRTDTAFVPIPGYWKDNNIGTATYDLPVPGTIIKKNTGTGTNFYTRISSQYLRPQ